FSGVVMYQAPTSGNVLQGNFIGTDVTGAHGLGNGADGVTIQDAPGNAIGGTATGSRNLISGNGANGIFVNEGGANTAIAGDWIGVDVSGSLAIPNAANGVHVSGAANAAITGNVISGNGAGFGAAGIRVSDGASGARVQGNFIGTDAAGTSKVPNRTGLVLDRASGALVGGADSAARNLISGNDQSAIYLTGAAAAGARIEGNYIGTNASGMAALGNRMGIALATANNVVGGLAAADRNVISGNGAGNSGPGVRLDGGAATGNRLLGNYIGTNATGTAGLGNAGDGV